MTAKRLLHCCAFFVFLFSSLAASAQFDDGSDSRFFVKLIGGYSFLGPASFTGFNRTERTAGPATIVNEFETNKKKFGIGSRFGLGVGYILNAKVNLGLDVVYINGRPLTVTNHINNQRDTLGLTIKTTNTHIDTRYEYALLNFVPHITFKAISGRGYYIYNRVGLIIGLPLKLNFDFQGSSSVKTQLRSGSGIVYFDSTKNDTYNCFGNFSNTPTIGYQAALGVQLDVSTNLRFFGEIEASSMVLIPKEFLYDRWINETEIIKTQPAPGSDIKSKDTAVRHMIFQKKGQERTVVNASINSIDVYTTQTKMATNSVGINIGLALRL